MTDTETSEASPPEGTDHERIERVEGKLDSLIETVSKLVPGSHAEAEQQTEKRLDRGSSVEEQVRAELAKAEREKAAQAAADADKADRETVAQRLARLEETPPAPPRLRRTAFLGWGDGRK